jgi:hypothetical protein
MVQCPGPAVGYKVRVARDMTPTIVVEVVTSQQIVFRLGAADRSKFSLDSLLVVDARGTPVWEFVKNALEPADEVQLLGVTVGIDVLSDAFVSALKAESWAETAEGMETSYVVKYGSVPLGYRQTVPESAPPSLEPGNVYRVAVFSSVGSGSTRFRR